MEKVFLVAGNTIRAILHRRILYLWIAAMAVVVLMALPAIFLSFGNDTFRSVMRQRAVSGALDTWSTLCIALAIFMGATAIGHERAARTLTTVFARPIRRWEFLTGKWVGIQIFTLSALATGVVVALGVGLYFEAEFDLTVFSFALAQSVVAIAVSSALAIFLSTWTHSIVAGAVAIFVALLPGFIMLLSESPNALTHQIGVGLDYAVPPGYTSHYEEIIHASIPFEALMAGRGRMDRRRELPEFPPQRNEPKIDYSSELGVLFQNVGYSLAFLALGCLVFSYRELR